MSVSGRRCVAVNVELNERAKTTSVNECKEYE